MLRPFGTVVAGAALAVLTTAVLSGSSTAATGPATIQIGARQTSNVRVDLGRDGTSAGDTQIIWYELYNRRVTSRPIGHAQLVCTFTRGANRECQGTYILPKGKLAVSGPIRFVQESIAELKKVEWPNQKAVVSGTAVVIIACIIVGTYLWLNDQLWQYLVKHVVLR